MPLLVYLLYGLVSLLFTLIILLLLHASLALLLWALVQRDKRLRTTVLKRYNALILPLAGKRFSPYGRLYHVGRRSGRGYVTPIGVYPFESGFVLDLAYGADVDWCRNVLAAGYCELSWHGDKYALDRPVILSASEVLHAYPAAIRFAMKKRQCVRLARAEQKRR